MKACRCLVLACCLAALASPAAAQFQCGLPGTNHQLAGFAVRQAHRVVLHNDVVHYWFDVTVGPGAFETVRIHRVVTETEPGRPVPKEMEAVLLLAGSPQLFEQIFLAAAAPGVPPEEGSIALYLASHGVDVWGMDYGWASVPYETTDFAPLAAWGIEKEVAHMTSALSIARWMRARSGRALARSTSWASAMEASWPTRWRPRTRSGPAT